MTLKGNILLLLTVSLFYSFSFNREKNGGPGDGDKNKKDTARAVVAYGDQYLFESALENVSDDYFIQRYDSLSKLDSITDELKNELIFYNKIAHKTEEGIYDMIDSLFDLDTIPYGLINQLNFYAALQTTELYMPTSFDFINDKSFDHPAQPYYGRWNNRVAFDYSSSISENDSTTVLLLRKEKDEYHHPLGLKTLRRYFGWVTSPFGWRDGRAHNGVDLELHHWDSIYCMFPGEIRMARNYAGYGKVVIVRHENGLESLYAHMSKIRVKEGDTVKAGVLLGHGGQTGNATGTHLHMEIRFKGVPLNPSHIISFTERDLHADTLVLKKMRRTYIAYPYGSSLHVVKRGEYPYKVAKRYGIRIEDLCAWNNITKHSRLVVGQKLRIQSN